MRLGRIDLGGISGSKNVYKVCIYSWDLKVRMVSEVFGN